MWLGIAALIVAVIAIPISIWAARRWGNRRARVEFSFTSVPMLPADAREGLLAVTYADFPVPTPYLVSITLKNIGPRDLPSTNFDQGKPISLRFDQTFYGITSLQGGVRTVSPGIGAPASQAEVRVQPGLLKRGEEWAFSAVLTGPVKVDINAPLIDTDVTQTSDESWTSAMSIVPLSPVGLVEVVASMLSSAVGRALGRKT